MVEISASSYEKFEIVEQEMELCRSLGFRLNGVTPNHFLVHFLRVAEANAKQVAFTWYLAELALLDYSLVGVRPSLLAASIINLARQTLLPRSAPAVGSAKAVWTPTLRYFTRYAPSELRATVRQLRLIHMRAWEGSYSAVRSKNQKPERLHVSECVICIPEDALRFEDS